MSSPQAVAAVTITLRNLLTRYLPNELDGGRVEVTARPLDKARSREGAAGTENLNQLNLFLYQTDLHPNWRNMSMPNRMPGTPEGPPPLPLNLYYLITAYGQNDEDILAHQLLGEAMAILHDHPLLTEAMTEDSSEVLRASGLAQQIDQVKITPQPLTVEDLSKLWTTFQTEYRISAAYQVSVVLIESRQEFRPAQPVVARGSAADDGIASQPHLGLPYPMLTRAHPPRGRDTVLLGEALVLEGYNLSGSTVTVNFEHPQLAEPNPQIIPAGDRSDREIRITIPAEPGHWPVGLYAVSATITQADGSQRTTNAIAVGVAPRIQALRILPWEDGEKIMQLECIPDILLALVQPPPAPLPRELIIPLEQKVFLILYDRDNRFPRGDRQLEAQPFRFDTSTLAIGEPLPTLTNRLEFRVGPVEPGTYWLRPRLRVDGIDSPLIEDRTASPPKLVDFQEVTVL